MTPGEQILMAIKAMAVPHAAWSVDGFVERQLVRRIDEAIDEKLEMALSHFNELVEMAVTAEREVGALVAEAVMAEAITRDESAAVGACQEIAERIRAR